MTRQPYSAAIGAYRALDSLLAPDMMDPHRRAWFEAWDDISREIHSDTARLSHAATPKRPYVFTYMGHCYTLTEGGAGAVCDAYAWGSKIMKTDGYSLRRVELVAQAIVDALRTDQAALYFES